MASPNSNSPGAFESVNLAIDRFMCEVHTCMPATVVNYDPSTQTATVQPTLQRVYLVQGQEHAVDLPEIFQVPVVFPATANAWLRLPLAAGDLVMVHFSERSLDAWSQTNGGLTLDPLIPHKFNLADAIAVPGLRPQSQAISAKGAATSLELCNGSTWIELLATGQVKITNGTVDLMEALTTFATGLNVSTLSTQAAAFVAEIAPLVVP